MNIELQGDMYQWLNRVSFFRNCAATRFRISSIRAAIKILDGNMIAIAETIKIGTIGIVCFHEKTATATVAIGLVVFYFPMQIRHFFVSFYKESGI